jgi:3-oxoacyl-[acyl-carrier-protein] synthase-3
MPALLLPTPQRCRVAGTGAALPERLPDGSSSLIDNVALVKRFFGVGPRGPRSDEDVRRFAAGMDASLGVSSRRWTHMVGSASFDGEQTTVDLQSAALAAALRDAGLEAGALAALLVATSSPAMAGGANAPHVARLVGARCAAWDVRAGCAGGVFSMAQAAQLVAASGQPVAVVGGDTLSKVCTVDTCAMMGDGAAAVVLVPSDRDSGAVAASLCSDGNLAHLFPDEGPYPPTQAAIDAGLYALRTGSLDEMYETLPRLYLDAIARALGAAGMTADDVDVYVPHQAGKPVIERVAAGVGVAPSRVYSNLARHGNTGAGSVLLALHEARQEGRVREGQRILFAAAGGELCWGALVFRM